MTATDHLVKLVNSSNIRFTKCFSDVLEHVLFHLEVVSLHCLIVLARCCRLILNTLH